MEEVVFIKKNKSILLIEKAQNIFHIQFTIDRLVNENDIFSFYDELCTLLDATENPKILIDFSKIKFLSSTALGKLLQLYRQVNDCNGKLVLCALNENVLSLLEITKLINMFTICYTIKQGFNKFS